MCVGNFRRDRREAGHRTRFKLRLEERSDSEREGWREGGCGRRLGVRERRTAEGKAREKGLRGGARERGGEADGIADGDFSLQAERLRGAGRRGFAAVVGATREGAFAAGATRMGLGADERRAVALEGVHGEGQSGRGDEEGAARHPSCSVTGAVGRRQGAGGCEIDAECPAPVQAVEEAANCHNYRICRHTADRTARPNLLYLTILRHERAGT